MRAAHLTKRPPRFAAAALSTYTTQLAVALLSFVGVLIVARGLGPSGRGDVALLTTITVLSSSLALLGIDEANVNLAGVEPRPRRALATNSLLSALVLGGACVGLLTVAVELVPGLAGDADRSLLWLAYAAVPVLILKVYLKYLAGADYAFGIANVAWLLPPAASVVVNGALAATGELTAGRAFGAWVAAHTAAMLMLVAWVAFRSVGFGRPSLSVARRATAFGAKSHFGRVLMAGNYRADQWFVGALAGSYELGLYSIAVAWSEVLFYLPTALVIVQRPYLVRADAAEAGRRASGVFRAGVLLTAVLAIGVVLVAPFLCVAFFGEAFAGATDDLRVLVFGAFGIVALKLLGNALTAQRLPLRTTAAAGIAFAVAIVLDVLLIPTHGGLGAAAASALAYTAGGAAIVAIFSRTFRIPLRALLPGLRDIARVRPAAAAAWTHSIR
jgi:O-antigen/teichoic acid export membrane protein